MKSFIVVCYDISCDKLRAQVSKFLETLLVRTQYSVFEGFLSSSATQAMHNRLSRFKLKDNDSIKIYPVGNHWGKIVCLGHNNHLMGKDYVIIS